MKRVGMALLASGAIIALIPTILVWFTVYSVVSRFFTFAFFPAAAVIAFSVEILAILVLRRAHLPIEFASVAVMLLGVNLAISALLLAPALLDAGCADSTSPRPCGFGPSVCAGYMFLSILAAFVSWGAIREVQRSPPPSNADHP